MTVLRSTTFRIEFKGQDGITGVKQFTRAVTDADSTMEQLNSTLGDNATVTYKTVQSAKELTAQARAQATQIERTNRKVANLKTEYSQMSQLAGKSASEQQILNAQFRLGVHATEAQKQEVAELVMAHQRLVAAQNKTQGSMRNTRGIAQNLGWQMQDTAVQLQMGTSAFTVLSQQGSQFASAFGPTGAVIGALIAVGGAIAGVAFNSIELNAELDKLIDKNLSEIKLPEEQSGQLTVARERLKLLEQQLAVIEKGEAIVTQEGYGAADVSIEYGEIDTDEQKKVQDQIEATKRAIDELTLSVSDLNNEVYGADLLDIGVGISATEIKQMNAEIAREKQAYEAQIAAAGKAANAQALADDREFYSEVERLRKQHESEMASLERGITNLGFQLDPDSSTLDTYLNQQMLIQDALDAQLISQQEAENLSLASFEKYTEDMSDISGGMVQSQLTAFSSFLGAMQSTMGQLAGLAEEGSAEAQALFYTNQAIAFANAIVSAEMGAAKALELGPVLGIPASSLIRGLGYASAGIIAGTTLAGAFDEGGVIPAGQKGIVAEYGDELVGGTMVYNNSQSGVKVTGRKETAEMMNGGQDGVTVIQHINVQGSGDKALEAAMRKAAQQGAEMGAKKGYALVNQDFSTGRGIRATLRRSIGA